MVTPLVRGLLGLEVREGGRVLRMAPQLPAVWDSLRLRHVPAGRDRYALTIRRTDEAFRVEVAPEGEAAPVSLDLAPAFPLDARVEAVTVNDRPAVFEVREEGDLQRVRIRVPVAGPTTIRYRMRPGTDVYVAPERWCPGWTTGGSGCYVCGPRPTACCWCWRDG